MASFVGKSFQTYFYLLRKGNFTLKIVYFVYSIEMGVLAKISKRLEKQGWLLPTYGGSDILMAAETGSGKTGLMLWPLVIIHNENFSLIMNCWMYSVCIIQSVWETM